MEGGAAMDFHSFSRRELQALCKNNKIPANMTNAAMADALTSLQHVEGLEELFKPDESEAQQSPEKLMGGSVCRTSTRRKPIKDGAESAQPLSRARGGMRKRITDDVPQTPAVPSSRRRAPVTAAAAASALQKTEGLACSTRRSVRLAEKKMAELSLNEKGKTRPIKMGDFSKEMPEYSEVVQENKSLSGADTQEVSEEKSVMTNDSEVVSDQKPIEVLESARDSKDAKSEVNSVMSNEKGMMVEDGACEEIMGVDQKLNLDDEMMIPAEKTGCDDIPVNMVLCDAEKSNGDLGVENEKDLGVNYSMSLDESSTVMKCGKLPSGCVNLVAPSEESDQLVIGCVDKESRDFDSVAVADGISEIQVEKADMTTDECPPPPLDDTPAALENLLVPNAMATDEIQSSTLVADPMPAMDPMPGIDIGEEDEPNELPSTMENSSSSLKKMSPHSLVSNEDLNAEIPFPMENSPTQLTPRKSSSKKLTTLTRMDDHLNHNKENIVNCGRILELIKEEGKKNKDTTEPKASTPLHNKSLRQLKGMVKKLASTQKNTDKQNDVQQQQEVGKARSALQALPENQA